ncbi:hypothetical protein [Nonomuraea sp. NPDC049607]|uniref:hypothetical protein n=1 Tax=Nonomuraea sp. NPDC049607 TaxID=3154732 RepID=UPI00343F5518
MMMSDEMSGAGPGRVPGTMTDTLFAQADDAFAVLSPGTPVAEARAALAGGLIGVVRNAAGRVVSTVTEADLAGLDDHAPLGTASLPPAIVADEDVTFHEYGASPAVTLLDVGARALVLHDGEEVTAVLPVGAVGAYFASESYTPPSNVMTPHGGGAGGGLGRPRTGLAHVVCAEPGCGRVNELASFNRRRLPTCVNRDVPAHTLRIGV